LDWPHESGGSNEAKRGVVMREGKLPYENWFDELDYATLGALKGTFFWDMEAIELSSAFEDFHTWLGDL
jgi:hypothetical protein